MSKLNISVIIPLYNKANDIQATLDSVYQQQDQPLEVIVINDGSTDDSLRIVEQYKFRNKHSNLVIVSQKNAGVSIARNRGVQTAKGKFIAFIDADDFWLPLYLTHMQSLIDNSPYADMFACRYQYKINQDEYRDAKIHLNKEQQHDGIFTDFFNCASQGDLPFVVSSVTMKRESFIKFGMFPVNEPMGEDQGLFTHIAIHGLIAYSPDIHVIYNLAADNRACVNNIPQAELPFSQRLTQSTKYVFAIKHNPKQKKAILTYCAAHLCHIAKLNINAMQFSNARSLLADKRCWLKPKHKVGLYLWSFAAQFKHRMSMIY